MGSVLLVNCWKIAMLVLLASIPKRGMSSGAKLRGCAKERYLLKESALKRGLRCKK